MSIKSKYKIYNLVSEAWEIYWFASVTSQVASDTTSRRYVTQKQLDWLANYYDVATEIDLLSGILAAKLDVNNPVFTGKISGPEINGTDASNQLRIKNRVTSPNSYIQLTDEAGGTIYLWAPVVEIDGHVNMNSHKISNLAAPEYASEATNKEYVDNLVAKGTKPKAAVKVASIANIASLSGLVIIDGYTLVAGNRILLKNQTTPSQNGIYTAAVGAWTKVTADSVEGALVFVENGDTHNDWEFYNNDGTTWIEYAKHDTYKSTGAIEKSSNNEFYVKAAGITNTMLAGSINWAKLDDASIYDNTDESFDSWVKLWTSGVNGSLTNWMSSLAAAIGLLRGTARYNTNNTETVAGSYALANSKAKVSVGTSAPVSPNNNDVWLDTTA